MKKQMTGKRVGCLFLAVVMLLSVMPFTQAAETTRGRVNVPEDTYLISQTDYTITSGVTESQLILNNATGDKQVMGYLTTVTPGAKITFKASYTGYYTPGSTAASRAEAAKNLTYGMEKTTEQAAAYEQATDDKVIFATNGDYYNMQTAQALGYLIMEGNVVQTGNGVAQEPYFAVLKDGSFAIREYGTDHSDVMEAVSGPFFLVKNGVNVSDQSDSTLAPRNSIGLKADGTLVTFLTDGRQAPISAGMTYNEMAEMLLSMGCVTAIYLDGGGSATYASVREGTDQLVVRNSPSDGPERTVASSLLMVLTADADGKFDHASLSPNNTVYTPGTAVQFSALGVDAAGGQAELPAGLTWSVPAAAGTISATGLYTPAEGFTGDVTVSLLRGATTVGSTGIVIADIDELFFTGESISLDFDSESDLGLKARCQQRTIASKVGDFTWSISSENESFGAVTGNTFRSGTSDSTMKGTVTVTYTKLDGSKISDSIEVEVGKMPVIIQDFEPDENGRLTAAHFHWGKESYYYDGSPYGMGYEGDFAELSVPTAGTNTAEPTYTTLSAPYRFTGNYDSEIPAAPIFRANGYSYYLWPNGTITEYCAGELKMVTREEGGMVRSGDYAMELDYDYASYDGSKNANFYVRYCGEAIDIEGYPSQIGLWIYAPEGTANYSLWLDVAVWNGSDYSTSNRVLTTAAGTNMGEGLGIDWTGWMYCYTNIEDLWPSISAEHPLRIRQGEGLLWMSYQPGKNLGGRYNGTLYFDDYRVVYGTNLDDLVNPVIDSVTLNGTQIAEDGSTVIKTQAVELLAAFHDPESQNRTGIDPTKTTVFIDGVSISADGSDTQATTRTTLGSGRHTVTVQVADGDGNVAQATRAFTVDAGTNTNISVVGSPVISIGGSYTLEVVANGKVSDFDLSMLNLNSDFGEPTVSFATGVDGSSTFTKTGFKKASLRLTGTAAPAASGTLATITFAVPGSVDPEVDFFTYHLRSIAFTDASGNAGTDAYEPIKLTVTAYYSIDIATTVVGGSCKITVRDINGALAPDVKVQLNGAEIGVTDANGVLLTDATASFAEKTEFIVTAGSSLGLSFEAKAKIMGFAGNADALPAAIHQGFTDDGTTGVELVWFSNPQYAREKAYVQYMTQAEYDAARKRGAGLDSDYRTVRGTTELTAFRTTDNAAYVNTVSLSGLTPDTVYCYCVGDGSENGWSQMATFRTAAVEPEKTSFYVLGDTQLLGDDTQDAESIAALKKILTAADDHGVDFGLQTGDFIDNGGNYTHYQQILDIFAGSAVGDKPLLTVLGNHEYYGSLDGKTANTALRIPAPLYYSVERGNVYLAVINNAADLNEAAQWLIEDAAKTDCAWKVLSLHQPAYFTNVNGDNGKVHSVLPAAADAAGIDIVFSGHDHSYARTQELTAGDVKQYGTTYVICGDLGEKSRDLNYAAVNNPDFHFAQVTQEYDALYLLADAAKDTLKVTVYDLDGSVVDTFTKEKAPVDPPPAEEHSYVYNRSTAKLTCKTCGEAAPADYTGWATAAVSGKQMYFIGGAYKTGWFVLGDIVYHFDATSGEAHEVTVKENVETTCDMQGYKQVSCKCGETYKMMYSNPAGHLNEARTAADGKTYYICTRCGRVSQYNLTFTDVKDDAWYAPYVSDVVNQGLFNGKSNVLFDPKSEQTRAEFVTVLWRMAKEPEYDNVHSTVFKDCALNTWYTAAVNWAAKNGIVNGITETTFEPNTKISRQQIATILYRYAQSTDMDVSATADLAKLFTDSKQISSYAMDAMKWAAGTGLLKGSEGKVNPRGYATRAEVATMISRFAAFE